jgi:hypothetical protein
LELHEYEQPGPKMRVRVFRIDRNETEPSLETIFIGSKIYEKRPGSAWQVEERNRGSLGAPRNVPKKVPVVTRTDAPGQAPRVTPDSPNAEYKDLGVEPKGSMRVFQRTVRTQLPYGGEATENTLTHKSWIDRSGQLKKDEYTTTNSKTGTTILTMEYEVDPTIRIEAPIENK